MASISGAPISLDLIVGALSRVGRVTPTRPPQMDRPIVSYDDFTPWTPSEQPGSDDRGEDGRSAKRGRWSNWDGGRGPSARRAPHPHWDEPQEPQPVMSYGAENLVHPESPNPFSTDNFNGKGVSPSRSTAPSIQQPLPTVKAKKRGKKLKNKVPRTISLTDSGAWDDRALMDAWNAANEEYEVGICSSRT
jgi:hypothetical protein